VLFGVKFEHFLLSNAATVTAWSEHVQSHRQRSCTGRQMKKLNMSQKHS